MSFEEDDNPSMDISKATCKVTSNTKGENVSMRVSEGATKEIVDEVVTRAVEGWKKAVKDTAKAKRELEIEIAQEANAV